MTRTTVLPLRRRLAALTTVLLVAVACSSGGTSAGTVPITEPAGTAPATSSSAPTSTSGTSSATAATSSTTARKHTVVELEQALEAEISPGIAGPGRARCKASGTLSDWQPVLCFYEPDTSAEFGGIHVSMLDNGRYNWGLGECCAGSPWAEQYPKGLLCRDLLLPPPDSSFQPDSDHLTYALAVYYWLSEGRPDRMDADRNGRPCETVYPAAEVDAFWSSVKTL